MNKSCTPKVTIIIPTYNQVNYIKVTIESALKQSYDNLEIVVVDDNSTDKTGKIAKECASTDSRIKYYCNQENIGRVANYRRALYHYATGEYVVNLDGDDEFFDNTFIAKAIKELEKEENERALMVVACKKMRTSKADVFIRHRIKEEIEIIPGVEFVKNIFSKYQFSHLTTIYNRKIALETNFYSLPIQSTDIDSILRLALKGNVILYNKIVGQWNETASNISQNYDLATSLKNLDWIESVSKELKGKINSFSVLLWRKKCQVKFSFPILIAIYKNPRYLFNYRFWMPILKLIIPIMIFILQYITQKVFKHKKSNITIVSLD